MTGIPAPLVVDALYRGLLDRAPEPEGLEHHLHLLGAGMSLAEIVHSVGHSREYFETWLRGGDLPELLSVAWHTSRSRSEPAVYFLHIMKTGGTSLGAGLTSRAEGRFCLTQIFLDHLVALPSPLLGLASLVAGHLGAMALDVLPAGTVSATVIRDPVERVLSHYAHVRLDPGREPSETADLTLEDFVHSARWRPYVENFQARNLVHRIDLRQVWRDRSPEDLLARLDPAVRPVRSQLPLQSYFELSPLGLPEPALRSAALGRLAGIEHVGVTERLEALARQLAGRWGTDLSGPLPQANVSPGRPTASGLSRAVRAEILEANSVDLALHEEARARVLSDARAAARAVRVLAPAAVGIGGPGSRIETAPDRLEGPGRQAPRPGTRRPPRVGVPGGRRWALGAAVVLALAITALDIGLQHLVLAVAPCVALFTGRWRTVGAVGGLAVALATILRVINCYPSSVV